MICVSIGRTRHKHMIAEFHHLAEQGVKLVELRLDYLGRAVDLGRLLADRPCEVVATCRRRDDGGRWQRSEQDRQMLLRAAIASGVDYVDLEGDIAASIPRYGRTKRIVSYHDFRHTPDNLADLYRHLADQEADVVKIATMANSIHDTVRMMDLVRQSPLPTLGICMGDLGTPTRILASRIGAPFTYATFSTDRRLAPGQINWQEMRDLYRCETLTEKTALYGVIADPVAHSHSPAIHNRAFIAQGLDACYLPFRVPAIDLEDFIEACPEMGIQGLSVTIPHKERALDLLTQAEAAAAGIGAVNTILFRDGQRLGYNTDYRAAMECIARVLPTSPDPDNVYGDKRVLILGAGGAARAIAWGMAQRGAEVTISGRTPERAAVLADSIGGRTLSWADRHDMTPDLLVNATPVGMHPDLNGCPYEAEAMKEKTVVFETIYNPEQTLLVKNARKAGCLVISGVEMFVRQAAYQYKLFTDRDPPLEAMKVALKEATSAVRLNLERVEA